MNLALKLRNLAVLPMALAVANGAAAPSVTMIELGTLGGSSSNAISVNDRQQVAGASSIAGDASGHAFFWTAASGLVDLGTLGGTSTFLAYRPDDPNATMNSRGEITGSSTLPGDASYHAFI